MDSRFVLRVRGS
ncbi:hypothetical protein MTR67_019270 [Solanum verrucosum]|uniref:Uncharacterized protein n=1 Tax=Solanum verrucosum TaxID=315347 RepID=A0AAF0TTT1_SOLVR|nr:hypothetical protein MTR67_019270 [Solanum verrucosum]